ncbi:MAG: DUF416 family protein [Pseudomonadota bacterium]
MPKAEPVTWQFIRYRLTDPVAGADTWSAEAFGLLVAERFYPALKVACRSAGTDDYGFFRNRLNIVWQVLEQPVRRAEHAARVSDLDAIAQRIPDTRTSAEPSTAARAIAAGTICHHLCRFVMSGDRDDIARVALSAYAGVYETHDSGTSARSDGTSVGWAASIPFDEIDAYETMIATAPGVRSELALQAADLAFVEQLGGTDAQRFSAVSQRAFGSRDIALAT